MLMFIWLDDERRMPIVNCKKDDIKYHAHNYNECIEAIQNAQKNNMEIWIHFDHDLGEEKTGYDVAKYILENQIELKQFSVHSRNPVGANNIYKLLTHYGYKYV